MKKHFTQIHLTKKDMPFIVSKRPVFASIRKALRFAKTNNSQIENTELSFFQYKSLEDSTYQTAKNTYSQAKQLWRKIKHDNLKKNRL